jgi:hypothetical protein
MRFGDATIDDSALVGNYGVARTVTKKERSPIKAGEVVHLARFPAHLPTIFSIKFGSPK